MFSSCDSSSCACSRLPDLARFSIWSISRSMSLWRNSWPGCIWSARFGFFCAALGEFPQEFVHRRAQLLHELVDFLVAGAALERLLERLLRLAKPLLGRRQVAFLDAERDLPEIGNDVAQRVVALGHLEARARAHDHQIVRHVVERVFRPQRDGVHQVEHAPLLVGVERQDAALFDDRPRQRIGERPLRQRIVLVSLLASWPASSTAFSVSLISAPAQTCSVRSRVDLAAEPLAPRRGKRERHFGRLVERMGVLCRRRRPARTRSPPRPRRSRPRSHSCSSSVPLTARFGSPEKRITGGLSGITANAQLVDVGRRRT